MVEAGRAGMLLSVEAGAMILASVLSASTAVASGAAAFVCCTEPGKAIRSATGRARCSME